MPREAPSRRSWPSRSAPRRSPRSERASSEVVPGHPQAHLLWALGLLAAIAAAAAAVRTRVARRRLSFAGVLVLVGLACHVAGPFVPVPAVAAEGELDVTRLLTGVEYLLIAC